jgi:hypothetical protein
LSTSKAPLTSTAQLVNFADLALIIGHYQSRKSGQDSLSRTDLIQCTHLPAYHDSSLGFWLSQRSMLYELLQVPLSRGFKLVSATDRSFPSSTCIDDERDTERGAEAFGTRFWELVLGVWR